MALVLFFRIRLLDLPLERDEGEFALMGRMILDGVPPYGEAYNHRLTGLMLGASTLRQLPLDGPPAARITMTRVYRHIALTGKGSDAAKQIIRRYGLAERLLTDVLGMALGDIEPGACEFEHVLAPELVDSICTLLGHPRECPHGGKIPEGECCRQAVTTVSSVDRPLADAQVGEEVKVAYVNTRSNSRMHKLSHFGIIPGARVSVHQRYPSFVIVCGSNQIALEEEIAREIYVWQKERPAPARATTTEERRRWRFRKGKG